MKKFVRWQTAINTPSDASSTFISYLYRLGRLDHHYSFIIAVSFAGEVRSLLLRPFKLNLLALLAEFFAKNQLANLNLKEKLLSRLKMSFSLEDWIFLGLASVSAVFVFSEIIYSLFVTVTHLFNTIGSSNNPLSLTFTEVFLQIFGIVFLVMAFFIWGAAKLKSLLTFNPRSRKKNLKTAWMILLSSILLFLVSVIFF